MSFKLIKPEELQVNPFNDIGNRWMLLAAGDESSFNFMTVSWGMLGVIWSKPAVQAYVRDSRFTKELMDKHDSFSLSVLKPGYEKALQIAGSKSGRDIDKVKETGLTPVFQGEVPMFEEAEYTIISKKVYTDFMPAGNFIDKNIIEKAYPGGDFHTLYIGHITEVYLYQ